jgi:hypothetical protein
LFFTTLIHKQPDKMTMKTTTDHTAAANLAPEHPCQSRLADWRAFAAAAGATLAAVSTADASIIYGTITSGKFLIDGQTARVLHTDTGFNTNLLDFSNRQNHIAVTGGPNDGFPNAKNYLFNSLIKGPFGAATANLRATSSGKAVGNFVTNQPGFLGFDLANGDKGWVRIEVTSQNGDGLPDGVTAIDYAYNDVSGGSIYAGEGIPSSVPEPSTKALALLALGSAGVLAWRRRRPATPAGR